MCSIPKILRLLCMKEDMHQSFDRNYNKYWLTSLRTFIQAKSGHPKSVSTPAMSDVQMAQDTDANQNKLESTPYAQGAAPYASFIETLRKYTGTDSSRSPKSGREVIKLVILHHVEGSPFDS
ncbi:hypothetical protein PIIN_06116 [Serendipita indica DSM 11827]|uniref:Uncharacterized protein n=1 Tax=Serendipita indica (strain DSM 11827) TaxID=1109443 RepID=G4TLI8_SERID|nr:hypothetical protein PIIN_06116 [Serendipita indica DSM 11827]